MRLSQKKTCYSCKALCIGTGDARCDLGYKMEVTWRPTNVGYDLPVYTPLEPCYKPLTNKKYMEIWEAKHG